MKTESGIKGDTGMPELPKTVEQALVMAIAAEIDANATYLHLAEITKKPESKTLYQNLARDEQWHKETLEERYRVLFGDKPIEPGSASIEGAVLRRKAQEILDEFTILNIAIEAETAAVAFYTGAEKITNDAKTKQVFSQLAKDEERHRDLLEKEIQGRQGKPTDEMELDNWVRE
ncbi:MAG: ferritin family protein [bacterium]|nr:ferritin family protein [bacterium]